MTLPELLTICRANGLPISKEEVEKLGVYAKMLREWNAKINLISRKDEDRVFDSHILHALTLRMPTLCEYDFTNKKIADLGTGGGLPGIPLGIVTPSAKITLMDSIQKKIAVCEAMISELKISEIRAVRGRAEELARDEEHARVYDAVVSRAVAPLESLVIWSKGLLKPGGMLLALKGGDLEEEIISARKLKFVKKIEERPLALIEYNGFAKDAKKLISVSL